MLLSERFGASDVIGALIVAAGILMVQMARIPAAPDQRSATVRTDSRS